MFDDDVPLYSEILPALWQGGTEDDDNIYHGQKRLLSLRVMRRQKELQIGHM